MKVLLVHSFYQQPGGEDQFFLAEKRLLKDAGCEVLEYVAHNDELKGRRWHQLVGTTLWNRHAYNEVRALVVEQRPQVVHVHNTFPTLSPSIYHAIKAEGIPIIQTLHNYRLLCLNATLLRKGNVCEVCIGKQVPWPGIQYSCYRSSRAASSVVASMLILHRAIGTWVDKVDRFLTFSDFSREIFIRGGLPESKLFVKSYYIDPDPGMGKGEGNFALYVGRLSEEKGILVLLEAWKSLDIPLKIVGDGPLAPAVREAMLVNPQIEWLGRKERKDVFSLMQDAKLLVFPSICYETFGNTIPEAYGAGLPVVASNLGSMAFSVDSGRTGLHFEPGNTKDLAEKVQWLMNRPDVITRMRTEVRAEYDRKYSAEGGIRQLLGIYREAAGIS